MTIRDEATQALARVDALHTALTHLVLEGGDLRQIAAEAAHVLGVGVLLTSTDGRERASAMSDENRAALNEARLVDATGRIRVERLKDDVPGHCLGEGEVRSLRVAAGGTDLARLVCVRPDGPITEEDVHALERVAIVAALLITRQSAVSAVENKYQGDFLRDLLVRGAGEESYVDEHVSAFGWTMGRPVVVVVAEIDPPAPRRDTRVARAAAYLAGTVLRRVAAGLASPRAGHPERRLQLRGGHPAARRAGRGRGGLGRLGRRTTGGHRSRRRQGRRAAAASASASAGSAPDVTALPEAYAQARRAVEIGRRVHGTGSTTYFDELGLHRLIALIPDSGELRAFARDVLGQLAESTTEAANLRETLQVLLDTNFNVAEAARLQFFHYNTMRYRVSKLERLLGPLSSDPHLRLDVAVALRVLEIAGGPTACPASGTGVPSADFAVEGV